MNIEEVNRGIQRHKKRRRIGRGPGSGLGQDGWSRTQGPEVARRLLGQVDLPGRCHAPGPPRAQTRVPQQIRRARGDRQLSDLERAFESGAEVNPETLHAKNLARARWDELKILGNGELTKKLKVCAHRFSQTAKEKIEQAGGEVVVLPTPTPVAEKKKQKRQDAAGASA